MIPIDLKGRRALVTGSESGLGAATADALAEAGADVAITYLKTPENAEKVAQGARGHGVKAEIVHLADVADPANVAALFQWMDTTFGGIDILVNNAGIDGNRAMTAESDPAAWRRVLEIDLFGAYYCAREAAARMGRQRRGVIVNTTSVHEFIPWSGFSAYTSAKAGLSMFTKTLAQEVADRNVRAVAVAPGAEQHPPVDQCHAHQRVSVTLERCGGWSGSRPRASDSALAMR